MPHKVRFSIESDEQLRELGLYIAEHKSERVAVRYITAIIRSCYGLATLPNRGTSRNHVLKGLRTLGFRRRVLIAFRVSTSTVDILAILYGGQDLETYFRSYRSFRF